MTVPIQINEDYQEDSPTQRSASPSTPTADVEFEQTTKPTIFKPERKGKEVASPRNSGGIKKKRICARWTEEENKRLVDAYVKFEGKNWSQIAKAVGNKTSDQCNQHWHRVLNPNISKKQWGPEEDALLFQRVLQFGESSWKRVSEGFHGRTDLQCRHRWTQCKKTGEIPLAISQALNTDNPPKQPDLQNPFLIPNILSQIPANPLPPPILPLQPYSSTTSEANSAEPKSKTRQPGESSQSKTKSSHEMTFVDETRTFSEPKPPSRHQDRVDTHPDFHNAYMLHQLPVGFSSGVYMPPPMYPIDMHAVNRQHSVPPPHYLVPTQQYVDQQVYEPHFIPNLNSTFLPINEIGHFNNSGPNMYTSYPMLDPNLSYAPSNAQSASTASPPPQQQLFYTSGGNEQQGYYFIQNQNGVMEQVSYPTAEVQNSKLPPSFQTGTQSTLNENPFMQPHAHSINFHSNPMTYFGYQSQQPETEFQPSAFKPIDDHHNGGEK